MKMKKLSLAIALGTVFAAPAAMAQSSVQLRGKLYPYLLHEKGSDATAPGVPVSTLAAPRTGANALTGTRTMNAGNSYLSFRGIEDLGGGMKARFQLEAALGVDDGTGAASGGGLMFNRNTFVGLDGFWGSVKLGNMDTIFKNYGETIGILGLSSGTFMSSSGVTRKVGFGPSSAASFHLRRANSVQYQTPEFFGGLQGGLQWSTNEAKTDNPPRDPRLVSMGVKWDKGPFYVALMHEIHWDLFGGSANAPSAMRNNAATSPVRSKDRATELTVEWRATKQHKFEFDVIRKEYEEDATVAGRFQSYDNMAYMVAMENRWTDKIRTAAHFALAKSGSCTRVAAACSTEGLEGKKFTVAAAYYLSKRTFLFAAGSVLKNDKSARYSNTENGTSPNPGEDIKHFAVGVSHVF